MVLVHKLKWIHVLCFLACSKLNSLYLEKPTFYSRSSSFCRSPIRSLELQRVMYLSLIAIKATPEDNVAAEPPYSQNQGY